MQEDWLVIRAMIESARRLSGAHITAKIRIMENTEATLRYAKMIEKSGVSLTVFKMAQTFIFIYI